MTNTYSGSGGGYGGAGGAGISGIPGGPANGTADQPFDRGSRGGVFTVVNDVSQGGGAIRLRVGGTLSLNGVLSANGAAALVEGDGGGAGGGIWVTARRLDGTGLIMANGGPGEPTEGGGGGGGRVAIYTRTNNFAGALDVFGGPGASPGGNGTIYFASIPAPQIIAQSPSDVVSYAVDTVNLTFSSPMDSSSVSTGDFLLDTPNGLVPQNSLAVSTPNLTTVSVSFPAQNTVGFYEIDAGPQIQDIYGLPMAATYIGDFIISAPTISGRVTDTNGLPVHYVTMRPDGGLLPAVTDSTGAYSLEVPPSWIGTITPSRGTSMFIPQSRSYTNVTTNLTSQDFIMVPPSALTLTQELQGPNVNLSWYGINGVTYQPLYSTNLVDWVPYAGPLIGTNGPMNCLVPMGDDLVKFFRFSTIY
jgi:hypothetical protein